MFSCVQNLQIANARANATGDNAVRAVAYATEAGQFRAAGLPSVICGPGSIDQAHQPDEFVALEQVSACEEFLRSLAAWAATD